MAKTVNRYLLSMISVSIDNDSMLTIEMAKPIQFTKVSPVPLSSLLMEVATNFENWGESIVTPIPQIHQINRKNIGVSEKVNGDIKQQNPEYKYYTS